MTGWSTPPTWSVGEDITAADLQIMSDDLNALWTQPFARKTATESVTSSTTLQNDDALSVAVAASTTYHVECVLLYDGATAGDLKVGFTAPASASFEGIAVGPSPTAASSADDVTAYVVLGTANNFGALGTGTTTALKINGVITTSGSGTLQLQWAQVASSGTATRVFANSYLMLRRVA